MKRSDSATPSPPPSPADPIAPPSKKSKPTKTPKSGRSTKSTPAQANGTWDPQKRAGIHVDAIAGKLELSKRQLVDQLVPKKANLRAKAVKAVSGEQ
ncbi:hypothetical protein EHS25_008040 [Saitozyma podzolica]|uniref:Uncharacterized protein n=1 Tax=Saitozyma podzolica TaxID=1890683 RepID=A0A427YNE5_9TREE|nr:hypothetical protein EHS25_008040 [Saitozyma podzolica]